MLASVFQGSVGDDTNNRHSIAAVSPTASTVETTRIIGAVVTSSPCLRPAQNTLNQHTSEERFETADSNVYGAVMPPSVDPAVFPHQVTNP